MEVKYFWGSTLYHMDDLPFELGQMPLNYQGFREKVQGVAVRKTIEALDQIKGLPSRGDVDPGEIPSLVALGLKPVPTMSQVCSFVSDSYLLLFSSCWFVLPSQICNFFRKQMEMSLD